MMTKEEKIAQNITNIDIALNDYGRYTSTDEVLRDVSEAFIKRLAEDNYESKAELRELFSKSPAWNDELDAIVINGTRTHDPDYDRICSLAQRILQKKFDDFYWDDAKLTKLRFAIYYFSDPNADDDVRQTYIDAIKEFAPNAYVEGKKKSRIFRDLCVALEVVDDTAGSDFQRLYAQFADELNAKQIHYKLYCSINPAHFITMSNPKHDNRGGTLTSCHSFNSTEYEYNNGCTGYARDNYTFIVFTAADPNNPETLNNRKTTRQIYYYKPGSGVLLQSRMYNTYGGTNGAQAESKVYRDLIQREISDLEKMPNLWSTKKYDYSRCEEVQFVAGSGFGGYEDWTYTSFAPVYSIRIDKALEHQKRFVIGTSGICIKCGKETSDGVYCNNCLEDGRYQCNYCEEYYDEDDLFRAYNYYGSVVYVCEDCLEESFIQCYECGDYHDSDRMIQTQDGHWICPECRDAHYVRCEVCGEYIHEDDAESVHRQDNFDMTVCGDCAEDYFRCERCGDLFEEACLNGDFCEECAEEIEREKEEEIA